MPRVDVGTLASAAWFEFRAKRLKQEQPKPQPKGIKFIEQRRSASRDRWRDRHRRIALMKLEQMPQGGADAVKFEENPGGKWYKWNKDEDPRHVGIRKLHPLHPKYMQGPPVNYDFVDSDGETDEHDADVNYEDMKGG